MTSTSISAEGRLSHSSVVLMDTKTGLSNPSFRSHLRLLRWVNIKAFTDGLYDDTTLSKRDSSDSLSSRYFPAAWIGKEHRGPVGIHQTRGFSADCGALPLASRSRTGCARTSHSHFSNSNISGWGICLDFRRV